MKTTEDFAADQDQDQNQDQNQDQQNPQQQRLPLWSPVSCFFLQQFLLLKTIDNFLAEHFNNIGSDRTNYHYASHIK